MPITWLQVELWVVEAQGKRAKQRGGGRVALPGGWTLRDTAEANDPRLWHA